MKESKVKGARIPDAEALTSAQAHSGPDSDVVLRPIARARVGGAWASCSGNINSGYGDQEVYR